MTDRLKIDVSDGKYTVVQEHGGRVRVDRYGQPWMDKGSFAGSKVVSAMAYELEELRSRLTTSLEQSSRDESIEMVREFNLAFGGSAARGKPDKGEGGKRLPIPMYQPDTPRNLWFNESGEDLIRYWVEEMEAAAREMKKRAKVLNENGMVVVGLAMTRMQLSMEELSEFWRAVLEADLTGALDAIADRQYVLNGDALMLGLGDVKAQAVRIVHAANMRKLGPDGKPIVDTNGRVQKPEGWEGPEKDLAALLEIEPEEER